MTDDYPLAKAILIFKGTKDGFGPDKFHQLCDKKGATLTLVQSDDNQIFGGFTKVPWDSSNIWGESPWGADPDAFIFSATNKQKYKVTKSQEAI